MTDFWYSAIGVLVFLVTFPFVFNEFRKTETKNVSAPFAGLASVGLGVAWPVFIVILLLFGLSLLMGSVVEKFRN